MLYKIGIFSLEMMQRISMQAYKGKSVEQFEPLAKEFYVKELKPLLSNRIVRHLKEHQQKGHTVILLSASLRYCLSNVVDDLGIDYLLCSELKVGIDGFFTGELKGELVRGQQKTILANQISSQLQIDLKKSYAYGDHITDLSILQLVGHPVAVEPEPGLRKIAEKNNWKILNFYSEIIEL